MNIIKKLHSVSKANRGVSLNSLGNDKLEIIDHNAANYSVLALTETLLKQA